MEELSLHVLDVVENSIDAGAANIEISIVEDPARDLLTIEIIDDGAGMDGQMLQKALDPFFTTRTVRRVGLGLPMLRAAARAAGGDLEIESRPGQGTRVRATFRHSHIDRQPLGDMSGTLTTLMVSHPEIHFRYRHREGERELVIDSEELRSGVRGSSGAGVSGD